MALPVLSRRGKIFVASVVIGGGAAIAHSFVLLPQTPGRQWMLLAALTLLSGAFAIKVPAVPVKISVSEALVFASALLFGPAPATLTVALDGLIVSVWARPRNFYRALFSVAEPAISVYVSAQLFFWLAGTGPLANQRPDVVRLMLPVMAFTGTYFALNTLLISYVVSFETGGSPRAFLRQHLFYLTLNYLGSLAVSVLLLRNATSIDVAALGVIVPLLVISYLTARIAVARVEDANRHLEQLNKLYLSTVETLAMAVDAKDQITHGHIRRVQSAALALARVLGINDKTQLRALEAAALLHDLGKLAVPEHILNKPAALTPVEFAEMKEHSSVGANLLSAIDFPYPVTPIVRHHHENWDGSGYPAGLSGSAIPLGARILAVVDCFDALTSDRPYRQRMTYEEAIELLRSRRGTMYDPLVVDTFVRMWKAEHGEEDLRLRRDAAGDAVAAANEPDASPAVSAVVARAADAVGREVAAIVPDAECVVCVFNETSGALSAAYVSHPDLAALRTLPHRLGQRVTGWVGANRRSLVNADPSLDLGELSWRFHPPLRSCLSTALIVDDTLVGVVTLYSPRAHRFTAALTEHLESLSIRLAAQLRFAMRSAEEPDRKIAAAPPEQVRRFERGSQHRRLNIVRHRHTIVAGQADLPIPLKPRKMLKAQLPSDALESDQPLAADAQGPKTAPADVYPIKVRASRN